VRVFVTGGTGYIGEAVVRRLVAAGHRVTGLARSGAASGKLWSLGAVPLAGNYADLPSWAEAAREHDVSIHLAFDYKLDPAKAERSVVDGLLAAARAANQPRRVIYTSGVWVLGNCPSPAAEDAPSNPTDLVRWRPAIEQLVLDAAAPTLSTCVVRPGVVFGGKKGIVAELFRTAVEAGAARFVGDGRSRWSMVHRDDLAELYLAAVESWGTGILHGTHDVQRVEDVARAASLAAGAGEAVKAWPLPEARIKLGKEADALCLDQVVTSQKTRERFGWVPKHPPFPACAPAMFDEWNS
jgi:nucleoside-diphosphate-sugar epimerase